MHTRYSINNHKLSWGNYSVYFDSSLMYCIHEILDLRKIINSNQMKEEKIF